MTIDVEGFGTLTANRDLMNYISLALFKAGEMYRREGADALARQAEEFSDEIYNQLVAINYYDE